MLIIVCAFLGVASYVAGAPVKYELESKTKSHITITLPEDGDLINFNILQDILESVQDAFFHTYGDDKADDGDVQGYSKKSDDDGEDGYKHFDSYHKKDGDKYAFEKHSEYGQGNNHEADADGHSGKLQESVEYEDDDDGEESKDSYQVIKHIKEGHRERRQAADDDDDDYESGERRRRRGRYRASDEDDDEPRYRGNDDDDDDY